MSQKIMNNKLIWLGINILMVIVMVIIGGITRLTDSGLSMTEWNLIGGIIPPMNEEKWLEAYDKYKLFPEYNLVNSNMHLIEFKKIFFWEYFHRIWGRIIGLTFFLPLVYFWIKGRFTNNEKKYLTLLSILGIFQAFMGWYMVKSGLIDRPDVSHFRLSIHLLTAFLIYSMLLYSFWIIFSAKKKYQANFKISRLKTHKKNLLRSLILLYITITAGALVSGTDAGLSYNNFPLMEEHFLPPILLSFDLFKPEILFYDQGFLQFSHRILATITLLFVSHTIFKAKKDNFFRNHLFLFYALVATLIFQYSLGIIILKLFVPIFLGLLHQIGALIILSLLIISLCEANIKNNRGRISP
ncbi:MAG: COX15/CtaA family protein [Pseudomonadota bacterium]|nr:COX15/CtaA family protein [Pseudomonadota bacterium]